MRVLHVVHQYPPQYVGGTELYTVAAAQGMAGRGHEVAVYTRSRGQGTGLASTREGAVTVYRAWEGDPSPAARYAASFGGRHLLAAFDQVMEEFRPDVVHVQHLMGLPLAILARLRRARRPYVVTLHDYWWMCANAQLVTNYSGVVCAGPRGYVNCTRCAVARSGGRGALLAPALWGSLAWRGALLHRGLGDAAALLASTRFVAGWYAAHGAPVERLRVLPFGVDRPADFGNKPRTPGLPLRLVYIGSLFRLKGVHVALEAIAGMEDALELWVAGDPPADPAYAERLATLAGANVHWMGRLNRAEVWRLLENADVMLAPSLSYETYCYSVHEALAAGVPVIASNLGVLAEAVQNGVNGLLAQPGDASAWRMAIRRVIDDPGLAERLAAGAVPPPDVATHLAQLEDLYHAVTES
ncbi:MAG: glycosyltransferase [Caldilineaceae bacterium]|nr:glycosyltransferase [Caldilineaceae bacterium]